jgi:6-phosphofructokinase 1
MRKNFMTQGQNRIAVLTSGGDAPGMNACIRAIVRVSHAHQVEVLGVRHGYEGLIQGQFVPLSLRSVGNIIQRGGTVLGSSRSPQFKTHSGRKKAYEALKLAGVDQLIVLGGDGTLAGAAKLSDEFKVCCIGIPCTIDNDLAQTDSSIGFDSAVRTAVECIDKIRDTADSHGRIFVVEVMGKNTGHIAIETALAVGAEFVLIPEKRDDSGRMIQKIKSGLARGKTGSIVIVAEGKTPGKALKIAKILSQRVQRDVRTLILGHLQRGGSPSPVDRNLASRFGALAVQLAIQRKTKKMTSIRCDQVEMIDFSKALKNRQKVSLEKLELLDVLSV